MHTARQLDQSHFAVARHGRPASRDELLPDWTADDRLGVVATEPFGAVGAAHLIQLAITAFYDARPSRRAGRPDGYDRDAIYPEIYLFHVGGAFGDHSSLDFWPARKEVFVSDDPRIVLDAVNDRAITRLAVPDGPGRPVEHEWKEPAAARDRIRTAYAYSPTGQVAEPEWSVRGLKRRTERNIEMIVVPEKRYANAAGTPAKETELRDRDRVWRLRTAARRDEAISAIPLAQARREAIRDEHGLAEESYRVITVDAALSRLV